MKRLFFLLLLSLFSTGFVTGCHTMAGAGEDIQQAGDSLEDEAEDHMDCSETEDC